MPFAEAVFAVEGVASIFGVNDFVTVTRQPGAEWDPIVAAVVAAAADEPVSDSVDEHGRPPENHAVVVGLDVGGTKTNATVLDESGTFLIDRMTEAPSCVHQGPAAAIEAIGRAMDQRAGDHGQVA